MLQRFNKVVIGGFLIVMVLSFVGCGGENQSTNSKTQQVETETPENQFQRTLKSIPDESTMKDFEYNVVSDASNFEQKIVDVSYTRESAADLTCIAIATGIKSDCTNVVKKIYQTGYPVSKVHIVVNMVLPSDKYGNTYVSKTFECTLSKATADKIKWDNFQSSNFADVADETWWNPGFVAAVKDEIVANHRKSK